MPLLDDIATFLDAQSTAFTLLSGTAGNLAKAKLLDHIHVSDTMAVLYETGGSPNEYTFSTSTGTARVAIEKPSLQMLSRSSDYQTARNQAQVAYTILDGLAGQNLPTATGTLYLDITAVQAPFTIGPDDNDRPIVSVNFDVWKQV